MSRISPEHYSHTMNGAFQNLVSEHSVVGVPASIYNLTKSVPDPFDGHTFYQSTHSTFMLAGKQSV